MARLQPIAERFNLAIQGTQAQIQKQVAAIARREHGRVMRTPPFPGRFERTVDGRVGASESTVKANGYVLYVYHRLPEVVQYAMDVLFDKSPVLSGIYRQSHTIFLNGTPVSDLRQYNPGDEIAISNLVPYARKIEMGKMTMRVAGTDHVYEQAVQTVKRRYGNVAQIRFTFRALFGGNTAIEQWASKTRFSAGGHRPGQQSYKDWTRRQPTMLITDR